MQTHNLRRARARGWGAAAKSGAWASRKTHRISRAEYFHILKTIKIFKTAATALSLCLVFQVQAEQKTASRVVIDVKKPAGGGGCLIQIGLRLNALKSYLRTWKVTKNVRRLTFLCRDQFKPFALAGTLRRPFSNNFGLHIAKTGKTRRLLFCDHVRPLPHVHESRVACAPRNQNNSQQQQNFHSFSFFPRAAWVRLIRHGSNNFVHTQDAAGLLSHFLWST